MLEPSKATVVEEEKKIIREIETDIQKLIHKMKKGNVVERKTTNRKKNWFIFLHYLFICLNL